MQERFLYKIELFAGTTEGRKLSEVLAAAGIAHTVCVATEYGKVVLAQHPLVQIHQGRMNREEIGTFVREGQFTHVIDATHPFAREITQNIKAAVEEENSRGKHVSYLRLKRDEIRRQENGVTYFETSEDCAQALEDTKGNILLTTGSKELFRYCKSREIKSRLYVRILPSVESLTHCTEQGIHGKQIIAMQGPFTVELNEAVIRQYHISYVVTKESGISGGYPEKIEAAKRAGAKIFVIGCPKEEEGTSFVQICRELEVRCERKFPEKELLEITLAGFSSKPEKHPFYHAGQIIPYLQKLQETSLFMEKRKIVILFSGDSGFYSGCQSLYAALEKEIREGRLMASLRILPGVSCVAYLAACTGESWHDAAVYSIHGKELCNLANRVKRNPRTFLLTSGVRDINRIGKELLAAGMSACEVIVGYQLSYPEQKIEVLLPSECAELKEEGLYTCLIENPNAEERKLTHGIADGQFLREYAFKGEVAAGKASVKRIPMTKEEVREIGICKLHLRERAVVYDIGSGTGSIAVEIAGLSDDIQVYAVEQKEEAVLLVKENKEKFGLQNIHVVKAMAPEGLDVLPVPTQAIIGGSGGRLKEILSVLWEKNRKMRIVIHAVSIETICEIQEVLSMYRIREKEIVQVQVSRARETGRYHLIQAENPVWICAFAFDGE